jgi:hypothetical protein
MKTIFLKIILNLIASNLFLKNKLTISKIDKNSSEHVFTRKKVQGLNCILRYMCIKF